MAEFLFSDGRQAAVDAAVDLVDGGSTAGRVEIRTSGEAVLASCLCGDPAAGAATGADPSVATFNSISDDTDTAAGTADHFVVLDSDNNELWRGSVGTSGAEMTVNTVTFCEGGTFSISAMTFSQPSGD